MSQKSRSKKSLNEKTISSHDVIKSEKDKTTRIIAKNLKEKQPNYQTVIFSCSGFILAFCATVLLSISYYVIKLSKSLNASEMGSIMFLVTMICCSFVAFCCKQSIFGPRDSRFLLMARGLTGSIALTLNFFSIQLISYGDSTVIRNSSPVITAIFARIFLKELLNISHFISLVISLAGIIFVARPSYIFGTTLDTTSNQPNNLFILGVSLGILSTVAIGSAFILIKKLTNKEVHFSVIIFYLSAIGCIICSFVSVALFLTGVIHKQWVFEFLYRDICFAVIAGLVNFLGHICFTYALIRENANTISIMRTLDILIAFLLEYLVFGIIPNYFSFVGASLIIASVCVLLFYKMISNKNLENVKKVEKAETDKIIFRV